MLYFFLIIPRYLVQPYMILGIVAVGMLSQINMILISKWFSSEYSTKGYQGFVQLLGKKTVTFFAFIGLFPILVRITVLTLGCVEVIHQYIFPSMNSNWLIIAIFLSCYYVASQGMEKTIRFVVITFFTTIWMLILFSPFFFPPIAALHDLYPIIPPKWTSIPWKGLLLVWVSMSGPEFLVFLAPWINTKQGMLKYLSVANAITIFECLVLFISSLLFFGSNYLDKTKFPVVDMLRYLQFPAYERIDIVMISLNLFVLVFSNAIFVLLFYGAIRIFLGKEDKETTRIGFTATLIIILLTSLIINEWFWKSGDKQSIWLILQIGLASVSYFIVPAFIVLVTKLKGHSRI